MVTYSKQIITTAHKKLPHVSVLLQVNVSMCCALGSSNEFDDVTDALVIAGTSVTIRNLSGDVVLQTIVETSQGRPVLADSIKQEYAKSAYIQHMCVRLEWTQPVRIQRPAGFELEQSAMHMEATLVLTAIPAEFDFAGLVLILVLSVMRRL